MKLELENLLENLVEAFEEQSCFLAAQNVVVVCCYLLLRLKSKLGQFSGIAIDLSHLKGVICQFVFQLFADLKNKNLGTYDDLCNSSFERSCLFNDLVIMCN